MAWVISEFVSCWCLTPQCILQPEQRNVYTFTYIIISKHQTMCLAWHILSIVHEDTTWNGLYFHIRYHFKTPDCVLSITHTWHCTQRLVHRQPGSCRHKCTDSPFTRTLVIYGPGQKLKQTFWVSCEDFAVREQFLWMWFHKRIPVFDVIETSLTSPVTRKGYKIVGLCNHAVPTHNPLNDLLEFWCHTATTVYMM